MSDPALALQEAVEAQLRGDVALAAAMDGTVRLYSMSAPIGAPYPYVTIGEDLVLDDSTDCAESSEAFTTVHVWSRIAEDVSASRAQAKAMAGAIRPALKALTGVVGFEIVVAEFERATHLTDPDGLTAHSIVSHRFLLDPA